MISRNIFFIKEFQKNSSNWTKNVKVVLYKQTISRNKIKRFKVDFPNFPKFLQIQQKKVIEVDFTKFSNIVKKGQETHSHRKNISSSQFFILFYKRWFHEISVISILMCDRKLNVKLFSRNFSCGIKCLPIGFHYSFYHGWFLESISFT